MLIFVSISLKNLIALINPITVNYIVSRR